MKKKTKRTIEGISEVGWKDFPEDILVDIFNRIGRKCLYETTYSVCRCWRSICRLMLFWEGNGKLVLRSLKNIGVDDGPQVMKLLKILLDALELKLEPVTQVLFPYRVYLSDDDLYYLAQRVPKILEVYLPDTTNTITLVGFSRAIQHLRELRCLSIGPIKVPDYTYIIQEIGINCKNLVWLRIYGMGNTFVLDKYTSLAIANNLGNVERLIFEDCLIHKVGLKNLYRKYKCLKGMIISGCIHENKNPKFHQSRKERTYAIGCRISEDNIMRWYATGSYLPYYNSVFPLLDEVWRSG